MAGVGCFNALSSLVGLIEEDPAQAKDVTCDVAALFRRALLATDSDTSTVADELAFIKQYLRCEQARLGDALSVDIDVGEDLHAEPIPSMLLQPLMENAIKHGSLDYPSNAVVIRASRSNDERALARLVGRRGRTEPVLLRLKEGLDRFVTTPDEVRFLRAAKDYNEVHLDSGVMRLVRQPSARWESRLPDSFLRIHRSIIVNLDHLDAAVHRKGAWHVRLRGVPETLPVSRRLLISVRDRLFAAESTD